MLSNLPTGTRLYMKSPEGPQLEVITLTHGPFGPVFTVTPNTCRYPGREGINIPHLLGFYNKYVVPEGAPRYLGNPFKILFLLDGDEVGKSMEAVEDERLAPKPEPEPKPEDTVPCACCDPDADYDDEWSYDDEGTEPEAMNNYMAAVAASSFKREEAKTLPPEDKEAVPQTYPADRKRMRFFKRILSVYVKLPGAEALRGIRLYKSLFFTSEDVYGINEWHLVASYRKRFKVEGPVSAKGLQAIYVESGLHKDRSLAELLLELTDKELAEVGTKVTVAAATATATAVEPPAPGAIGDAMARISAKEQALLQELAELEKVQAAMARIAALEARVAEARQALKGIM